MKTLLVINLTEGSAGASKRLAGKTVFGRVLDYALSLVPKEDLLLLVKDEGLAEGIKTIRKPAWTDEDLMAVLLEASGGYEDLIYVYGDTPFLDSALAEKMLQNHRTYFAEYTFADGYPHGLTPEILKTRILVPLKKLLKAPASPVKRDTLFTVLQRDINAFDLETELSPEDQRLLRVSLSADTKRNFLLCERLAEALGSGGDAGAENIAAVLKARPELLRTLPAYVQVQISGGCPQACTFCPYPRFGGPILEKRSSMKAELFETLARELADFSGDAVIDVSLWGEPAFHEDFGRLAKTVAAFPDLKLLIETSGIGWKDEVIREVRECLGNRASWILSLETTNEADYKKLRGSGFAEAMQRTAFLFELFPETAYVQALRMKENEDGLETFFRTWKEKTANVIIQKYDWFSGYLEQKKVTDLSPLKRFPCWHLKRDLAVLLDGTVPLCREDIEGRHRLGRIGEEPLSAIWARGEAYYLNNLKEAYPEICGRCDEYYTYNF